MKHIWLCISHPREANFLESEYYPLKFGELGKEFVLGDASIQIVFIGAGKKDVQKNLKKPLSLLPDRIINLGTCGSLDPQEFPIKKIVCIREVIHLQSLRNIGLEDLQYHSNDIQSASIISCEKPILKTEEHRRIITLSQAKLVDMEAFFIAEFSKENNISCAIYKIVSDYANEQSIEEYSKRLSLMKQLWSIMYRDI